MRLLAACSTVYHTRVKAAVSTGLTKAAGTEATCECSVGGCHATLIIEPLGLLNGIFGSLHARVDDFFVAGLVFVVDLVECVLILGRLHDISSWYTHLDEPLHQRELLDGLDLPRGNNLRLFLLFAHEEFVKRLRAVADGLVVKLDQIWAALLYLIVVLWLVGDWIVLESQRVQLRAPSQVVQLINVGHVVALEVERGQVLDETYIKQVRDVVVADV